MTNRTSTPPLQLTILDRLKEWLLDRKSNFVTIDEWCGNTEIGFWDEEHFDMGALMKEIDTFGEELRERAGFRHGDTEV